MPLRVYVTHARNKCMPRGTSHQGPGSCGNGAAFDLRSRPRSQDVGQGLVSALEEEFSALQAKKDATQVKTYPGGSSPCPEQTAAKKKHVPCESPLTRFPPRSDTLS